MGRGNKGNRKSGKKLRTVGSHHDTRHSRNEEESKEQGGRQDQYYTNNWVIDIMTSLEEGHTYDAGRSWTIYRVPNNLCEVQKNAFLPKIISVGPFHYRERDERLQVMEEHKMRFLMRLLGGKLERRKSDGDMSATTKGERESDDRDCLEDNIEGRMAKAVLLDDLVEAMQMLEEKTRACYSESFDDIGGDDFVEMMVVDGCFMVELLRLYYDSVHTESPGVANVDDPIFTTPWMLRTLQRDLLMLENQLPFFVLEKLSELIDNNKSIDRQAVSLEVLAVTFFDPLLPRKNADSKLNTKKPYAHLLDVFRSTFLKSVREKVDKQGMAQVKMQSHPDGSVGALVRERQLIHCVSELREAGVQFKKRKGQDLLDINFAHRTLQIPPLSMDDNTVPLFLNFVAYEQCHDHAKPYFTNYFMFWDSLVNSPRGYSNSPQAWDHQSRVGKQWGRGQSVEQACYLYNEIKEVNDYSKPYDESKYRVWWRNLIRERFSSPWTCLSLFAAIILLLLTLLQTLYTVYPYYRPH
ncbi:hypothetical protein NL676_027114 [Syzygium grande]|nr:hypothetical protein NL676_027114 [Syzygium grande]